MLKFAHFRSVIAPTTLFLISETSFFVVHFSCFEVIFRVACSPQRSLAQRCIMHTSQDVAADVVGRQTRIVLVLRKQTVASQICPSHSSQPRSNPHRPCSPDHLRHHTHRLRSHQFHPHTRRRNHQVPPQQNQGTHKHHPGHRTGRSKSLDTNRSNHSRNPRPCCICRHSSRRSHQGNHQARRIFHQKPSGYVVCMLVQCGSVCPKPFLGTNCTCRGIYGECVRRRRWTKPSTN